MPDRTPAPTPPRPAQPLPPRVTTPLLTLVTQQSMDEDYLLAAERRVREGTRPRRPARTGAVVTAVFGMLVAVAAVQTARNADVEDAGRNTLVARIEDRRAELAAHQNQIAELREQNVLLEDELAQVSRAEQRGRSQLRRLQAITGTVAVTGPGIRVVADNPQEGLEQIRKEDLFLLINGLWGAGAEAISLNGRRLGVQTSINNSGSQINIELASIRPPYTLLAIGDPRTLQADFSETTSFARFAGLRSQYGFRLDMRDEGSIELPGARLERLVSIEEAARDGSRTPETGPDRTNEENAS